MKAKCERWMARGDSACRNCAGCENEPEPETAEVEETDSDEDEDDEQWFNVTVERRETVIKSHAFRVKARDLDEACVIAGDDADEFDWGSEDIDDWEDVNEITDTVVSDNQED